MIVLLKIKKPIFREYIHYLFALEDGSFSVFRKHDFGKMLCSLVSYSNMPIKEEVNEETLKFTLPISRATANAQNYHLYYSKEDEAKLNDYLEVIFNIDFDRYYLNGSRMGFMQKDIIHSFIISRKLTGLIGNNEMLKKRQYRSEKKILENRTEQLIKRAYYRNHAISNSIKRDILIEIN